MGKQKAGKDPIDEALELAQREREEFNEGRRQAKEAGEAWRRRWVDLPKLLEAVAYPLAGQVSTPWATWDPAVLDGINWRTDPKWYEKMLPLWEGVGRAIRELGLEKDLRSGLRAVSDALSALPPGKAYQDLASFHQDEAEPVSHKAIGAAGLACWTALLDGPWEGEKLAKETRKRFLGRLKQLQTADPEVALRVAELAHHWHAGVNNKRREALTKVQPATSSERSVTAGGGLGVACAGGSRVEDDLDRALRANFTADFEGALRRLVETEGEDKAAARLMRLPGGTTVSRETAIRALRLILILLPHEGTFMTAAELADQYQREFPKDDFSEDSITKTVMPTLTARGLTTARPRKGYHAIVGSAKTRS